MGIVDRPLKVCLVDLNVKDGQLGFIVGKIPTILQLLGAGLSEEEVDKIAIHTRRTKLDVSAPNLPRYADNIRPVLQVLSTFEKEVRRSDFGHCARLY